MRFFSRISQIVIIMASILKYLWRLVSAAYLPTYIMSCITNCEIFKLLSICRLNAYRNRKVQLNIIFVTKDWVHSQSSCRVNRRQRLMRDDFKNKFSNNRRVFSFNHLYICFLLVIFISGGGGELENYQVIFAEREGEQPFWQTVNPVIIIIIIIFYLFFAYTLCRVSIKNYSRYRNRVSETSLRAICLENPQVPMCLCTQLYYIKHFGCRYVFAFAQFLQTPEDIYYILYCVEYT